MNYPTLASKASRQGTPRCRVLVYTLWYIQIDLWPTTHLHPSSHSHRSPLHVRDGRSALIPVQKKTSMVAMTFSAGSSSYKAGLTNWSGNAMASQINSRMPGRAGRAMSFPREGAKG